MLIDHIELQCHGIDKNVDDWAVVSVSALYCVCAAVKTGNITFKTKALSRCKLYLLTLMSTTLILV